MIEPGSRIRLVSAAALLVFAGALAGCTPSPPEALIETSAPTPYAAPSTVGETVSSSPLESDEWVIAARAGALGIVLANNAADFSIEPFVSTWTADGAQTAFAFWSDRFVGLDRETVTWPGPPIVIPISVELIDDNNAIVRWCDGSDSWESDDPGAPANGVESSVTLVRTDDGIRVASSASGSVACDATGAPVATFDPAPVVLGVLADADVVPPPPTP